MTWKRLGDSSDMIWVEEDEDREKKIEEPAEVEQEQIEQEYDIESGIVIENETEDESSKENA